MPPKPSVRSFKSFYWAITVAMWTLPRGGEDIKQNWARAGSNSVTGVLGIDPRKRRKLLPNAGRPSVPLRFHRHWRQLSWVDFVGTRHSKIGLCGRLV
jgi:hypothetical protein